MSFIVSVSCFKSEITLSYSYLIKSKQFCNKAGKYKNTVIYISSSCKIN